MRPPCNKITTTVGIGDALDAITVQKVQMMMSFGGGGDCIAASNQYGWQVLVVAAIELLPPWSKIMTSFGGDNDCVSAAEQFDNDKGHTINADGSDSVRANQHVCESGERRSEQPMSRLYNVRHSPCRGL